jgi:hypothetical protein
MAENEYHKLNYANKQRSLDLRNCGLVSIWCFSIASALFAMCMITVVSAPSDSRAGVVAVTAPGVIIAFAGLIVGLMAGLIGVVGRSTDRQRSRIGLILNTAALSGCVMWFIVAVATG